MTREEVEEYNIKFIDRHSEFVKQIQSEEDKLFKHIYSFFEDITLPRTSFVIASKMKKLFETFQNSGKPFGGILTMILVPPYLLKYSYMITQDINDYLKSLVAAAERGDKEEFARLYSEKANREKSWQELYDQMTNFDFLNDIEDVVKTADGIPASVGTKEHAIEICKAELKAVGYVPKAQLIIGDNLQIGQTPLM